MDRRKSQCIDLGDRAPKAFLTHSLGICIIIILHAYRARSHAASVLWKHYSLIIDVVEAAYLLRVCQLMDMTRARLNTNVDHRKAVVDHTGFEVGFSEGSA
jgi:hypothetical protein